jgi:hypothetical protein
MQCYVVKGISEAIDLMAAALTLLDRPRRAGSAAVLAAMMAMGKKHTGSWH